MLKPRAIILLLVTAGMANAQHGGVIQLPKMEHAIYGGMSLREIQAALPNPDYVAWEALANGTTFLYSHAGYPLLMQLHGGGLLDVTVTGVKANSKFGKWFDEQVAALSPEALEYQVVDGSRKGDVPLEVWITPQITWQRGPAAARGRVTYKILFSTELKALPGGMLVRRERQLQPMDVMLGGLRNQVYDTPPRETFGPSAGYPKSAAETHTSGEVTVQMLIDEDGHVQKWMILNMDPVGAGFGRQVEAVVMRHRFDPALKDGRPVQAWYIKNFEFKFFEADELYLPRAKGR